MATFKLILDKRTKKKDDKYNLAVRVVNGNDVMYLNVSEMTLKQYEQLFIKKSMDEKSIAFREKCNGYVTKCEKIYSEMNLYNKEQFRELFYKEGKDLTIPKTLLLKELFPYFIKQKKENKIKTRHHYNTSMNVFETFKKDVSIADITPAFLHRFEERKKKEGCTVSAISSYMVDLRTVINYFTNVVKLIPKSYEYPFGKGGYSIKSYFSNKLVMSKEEIQSVIDFKDFDSPQQEYARNIWLFLYRCNGINFADLLRMRWSNIKGGYFVFFRMKTENTRKSNIKEIVAPITPKVKDVLEKICDRDSPFIIGKLKEGYSEETFDNKNHKMKQQINRQLTLISDKLNLSIPLKIKTARESYATTLKRAGIATSRIGEMMGHANSIVTEHYLASLDMETTIEVNEAIL